MIRSQELKTQIMNGTWPEIVTGNSTTLSTNQGKRLAIADLRALHYSIEAGGDADEVSAVHEPCRNQLSRHGLARVLPDAEVEPDVVQLATLVPE